MTSTTEPIDLRVGSVLFTDLVGFTEFNDAAGDVEALEVLEHQANMVEAVLDNCDAGRVVKELGDGLMIWFGSAIDGLESAVAILNAVESSRAVGDFPLAMRMGIHHGEAIARGDDLVGQTINIASRVSDLAGPGELLVSETVVSACVELDPDLSLRPIGPAVVKGVQEPVWLYLLTA